jgi:hypothetical protein
MKSLSMRGFLLTMTVALGSLTASAAEGPGGRWEGVVRIPDRTIGVVVDLADDGHGAWNGSATLTGFDLKGAPLSDIHVQGAEVSFSLKGVLGDPRFDGRLETPEMMEGHFVEAGNSAPFELLRKGPPEVEPVRHSTPVSPALVGEWRGNASLSGNPVQVRLTFANQANGPATVHFVLTGHREHDLLVDLVLDENGFLTVHSPEFGGVRYLGELKTKDAEIVGTLGQGPFEGALVLRPAAPSAAKK